MIVLFVLSELLIMKILKMYDVCYTAGAVIGLGIMIVVYLLIMDFRGEI